MIKKIAKDLQFIKDMRNHRNLPYVCKVAASDREVMAARRLQAQVYLEKGNISESQIDCTGVLDDETDGYVDQSTYFVVLNADDNREEPIAAARQINPIEGIAVVAQSASRSER